MTDSAIISTIVTAVAALQDVSALKRTVGDRIFPETVIGSAPLNTFAQHIMLLIARDVIAQDQYSILTDDERHRLEVVMERLPAGKIHQPVEMLRLIASHIVIFAPEWRPVLDAIGGDMGGAPKTDARTAYTAALYHYLDTGSLFGAASIEAQIID